MMPTKSALAIRLGRSSRVCCKFCINGPEVLFDWHLRIGRINGNISAERLIYRPDFDMWRRTICVENQDFGSS